ncbi:MAG: hypothetical protein ACJAVS_000513 [Paracoccaceae bacterium]
MEGPARVSIKPGADLRVRVGGAGVQDHVHDLADRDVTLKGVEQAEELLMPLALHLPPKDLAGEDF